MSRPSKSDRTGATIWRLLLALVLIAAAVLAAVAIDYRRWSRQPVLDRGTTISLQIPHGTPWEGVVDLLASEGVVDRPKYFSFWGRMRGLPADARAGEYELRGPLTLVQLDERLRRGGLAEDVTVSIPEGFNLWAIADALEETGLGSRREFLTAARDRQLLAEAGIGGPSFEGFLFPDTYRFSPDASAEDVIRRMYERWEEVWQELGAPATSHGLDRDELVTLASIVEKETALPSERAHIARVFYNRLEKGMRLQTDPTCVYSESRWDATPTPADCRDPTNRYSTYVIDGLPPGPIANPGREALRAVLEPAGGDAADDLYFVAKRDGTGAHYFSETLAEHNRAVDRYLR